MISTRQLIWSCLCLLFGCITPLDLAFDDGADIIVVEGYITDAPGAHLVRITRSATYGDAFTGNIDPVIGASVIIKDDLGNIYQMHDSIQHVLQWEDGCGYYPSLREGSCEQYRLPVFVGYATYPDFCADPTRTYSLQITTSQGKEYVSAPQRVPVGPPLDSISLKYSITPTSNRFFDREGIEIRAAWRDPDETEDYYMWKTTGQYRFQTAPENDVNNCLIPSLPENWWHLSLLCHMPPLFDNPSGKTCCATCYSEESFESVRIMSDQLSNGGYHFEEIGFVPNDSIRFMDQYNVQVEQLTISKEAYRFHTILKGQLDRSGSIFDLPPATIGSNIFYVDNAQERLIGFFGVYGSKKLRKVINDTDIPKQYRHAKIINDDCRRYNRSETQRPYNWISG